MTLDSESDQSGGEHDRGRREEPQPTLLREDKAVCVQSLARAVAQLQLALYRLDAASDEAHVVGECALRERQEHGERRPRGALRR